MCDKILFFNRWGHGLLCPWICLVGAINVADSLRQGVFIMGDIHRRVCMDFDNRIIIIGYRSTF